MSDRDDMVMHELTLFSARLNELDGKVTVLTQNVEVLRNRVETIQAHVDHEFQRLKGYVDVQFDSFKGYVDAQFESMADYTNKRFNALDIKLDALMTAIKDNRR